MFRKSALIISLLNLVTIGSLGLSSVALAQPAGSAANELGKQLQATAGENGADIGDPVDPRYIAVFIIRTILTLVGTVMFALMVYGGYLWMTAGGNDEQVTQAKTTLRNAVIGLIIVTAAYGITIAATNLAAGRRLNQGAAGPCTNLESTVDCW